MSITFPKTWTTGEVLNAEDVRSNADALKLKQQQTNNTDFELARQWYDTNHIMDSRYSPTDNISVNVSGVFAGRTNNGLTNNLSYCSRWFSNGTRVRIPLSTITFDILAPCTIVFMWSMVHQSPKDGDGSLGFTRIKPGLNSVSIGAIGTNYYAYEQPSSSTHSVLIDGTRTSNGVVVRNINSPIKDYSIGLIGTSTAGKCQNVSWNVSLECFYL